MAERKLKSEFNVTGANTGTYTIEDIATCAKESFAVDLSALAQNAAELMRAALNGIRIRMREATGGATFEEARNVLGDFIADISAGRYPVRQRDAGETRNSPFILAIAAVLCGGDTAAAQRLFDDDIAEAAKLAGIDLTSEDEAVMKAAKA